MPPQPAQQVQATVADIAVDPDAIIVAVALIVGLLAAAFLLTRALARGRARLADALGRIQDTERLANVGTWSYDPYRGELQVSAGLRRLYGLAAEGPVTSDDLMGRIHPDDRERVFEHMRLALSEGTRGTVEYRAVIPGEGERMLLVRGEVLTGPDGEATEMRGTVEDVTSRRIESETASENAARMREAQLVAGFGSFAWDVARDRVSASEVLCQIFGLPPTEEERSLGAYLASVHPADRDRVERAFRGAAIRGGEFIVEGRIVRPGGEERLLRTHAMAVTERDGQALRVVGMCQDLTRMRLSERARLEAEARFHNAFEHAPIGIALVAVDADPASDGRLLDVNHELCRMTGYTARELLRSSLAALTHPDDVEAARASHAALLAGELMSYETEQRCLRAGGDWIWTQRNVSLVRDERGRPRYTVLQMQDISERKHYEGRLQYLADHDPLTGLPNRRRFIEQLDQQIAFNRRYGGDGAVIVFDLDRFKYVNDTLGHGAGNELLSRIAKLLRERLRETDMMGRLGGDEFAVLLPQGDLAEARRVAEKLGAAIRDHGLVAGGGKVLRVTASIGVAPLSGGPQLTGELALVNADIAMYQAKDAGPDRVEVLERVEESRTRIEARAGWLERIRSAIEQDAFMLYGQPIAPLGSDGEAREELLLRMTDDAGRIIPAASFVPVAEEFGIIQDVDRWVVREAVALMASRQRAGTPTTVAVNLSGSSITDLGLVEVIERELAASGVDPTRLVFEVTETAAIVNVERASEFAERLHGLGCGFALDDFGAGFGSFYYLKRLPFEYLKIDGEFIRQLPASREDQLTVQAIVQIAAGLGKQTIAEFVEDEATVALLRRYGVDFAQGYHIGMPVPANGSTRRLTRQSIR